jgi:hypothetical protein
MKVPPQSLDKLLGEIVPDFPSGPNMSRRTTRMLADTINQGTDPSATASFSDHYGKLSAGQLIKQRVWRTEH